MIAFLVSQRGIEFIEVGRHGHRCLFQKSDAPCITGDSAIEFSSERASLISLRTSLVADDSARLSSRFPELANCMMMSPFLNGTPRTRDSRPTITTATPRFFKIRLNTCRHRSMSTAYCTTVLKRLPRCLRLDPIWVRLFFVEEFSPYSWAFLPADASLQCSVRGDSNQASAYPRLSGAQPSLETVPNTVGLSPSGALPSGHSRGVLVRFHGQGDRPVMALTTGFQGRRFDVPEARTGVPRIDLPSPAPCAAADAVFADAKAFLSSNEARQMSESELERELHRRGQKLVRKLLQGHHDQRSPGQAAGPAEDASGVECSARREHDSHAETTSGTMQVVGRAHSRFPGAVQCVGKDGL